MSADYTCRDIAKMIDLSLLNPTFTAEVMEQGFKTALEMVRQGDTDANTMEIDAQAYKLERIESVARIVLDCGGTKTKVLNSVLGAMDSVANFQKALIEQCTPEVAKKSKNAIEKAISGNK